jgi:transcriptional regulator with XRE-family HTH domain
MKRQSSGFDRLYALVRRQKRIAEALELSPEQVSRIATGKSPPPVYMEAIAELLEQTPPQDWPARWK